MYMVLIDKFRGRSWDLPFDHEMKLYLGPGYGENCDYLSFKYEPWSKHTLFQQLMFWPAFEPQIPYTDKFNC